MHDSFCPQWIFLAATALLVAAGCQQSETPTVKRARLIAAQYMEMEKSLAELQAKVEKLKSDYDQEIKAKEAQLAAYRQKVEDLQAEARQALSNRVNQVTTAVLDENARLRKEVDSLRAQLEQRMHAPPPTEDKPQP
jgi:chromosome segregation ATPase